MITAILLAAGAGVRFGGDKLLADVAVDTPICIATLQTIQETLENILAVVRPGDVAVQQLLARHGARVVVCERAHEGMGYTLGCGVRASEDSDGWIVALADMPFIKPATISAIAGALRAGALIAAPTFNGERGHPVGFSRSLRDELLALGGDQGAREVIKAHTAQMRLIDVDDPGVLADIDTRAQLARYHP